MINYLCENFDYLKMNFETHHDIYLPASQCWHMIYTLNFFIKKKEKKQKKFDVNTRDPRRARWNFQGVLDDSLFLYLEFDMNKYLKNWGNYEVLQMKLGYLLSLLLLFIYRCFMGSCTVLRWFYTRSLAFSCIDRFIPTVASLFWCVFVYIYIFYLFVVCRIY